VDKITDTKPMSLAAWNLIRSRSGNDVLPADTDIEFAGIAAPKQKFLYTVTFEFSSELFELYKLKNWDASTLANNIYPVKSVTRPNITINYVDMNSYNYRFKVATKTDYGNVNLVMYDDSLNTAHNLFLNYLNIISPVSKKDISLYNTYGDDLQEWSSVGPIVDKDGLLKTMSVTHYYYQSTGDSSSRPAKIIYSYINPKILNLTWDELDYSQSESNLINVNFVYDSVHITNEWADV
jgi:hypothetical protein